MFRLRGLVPHPSVTALIVSAAIVGASAGCRPTILYLVVNNDSSETIAVRYREAGANERETGAQAGCMGASVPPRVLTAGTGGEASARRDMGVPADLEADYESCNFSYSIPAGATSLIFFPFIVCSDYEDRGVVGQQLGDPVAPNFELLAIETVGGSREWRGLDAARQFDRRGRGKSCFLEVK
jgi:hypothetical protein